MANLPADVINQALDAAGVDIVIGDPEEGTREAQVCLRAYVECVRQLQRAAHWDFTRKQGQLQLLADATGQTPDVGTTVPLPWVYEYSYPTDCLKLRFIPWNNYAQNQTAPPGNNAIPNTPLTTNSVLPTTSMIKIIPAPFVVGTDFNYPTDTNSADGQWWETPGVSPQGRTVIMTNVNKAFGVYTAFVPYVNMWDPLFRAAMVSYLASEIVLPLAKDKKFGLQRQTQLIAVVKKKLELARITDGNEGWYSTDHKPDWMQVRNAGGWGNGWGAGIGLPGVTGYGWDACTFSDGSAY
jgi:hypothetical protein